MHPDPGFILALCGLTIFFKGAFDMVGIYDKDVLDLGKFYMIRWQMISGVFIMLFATFMPG